MPIVVDVVVDPTKVEEGAKRSQVALEGVERSGLAAAKAVASVGASTTVTKLDETARATTRVGVAGERAAKGMRTLDDALSSLASEASAEASIQKLNDELAREITILERIRGPEKRYHDDLQALDSLLSKGKITVHDYANEVRRLNQELERTNTISKTDIRGGNVDKAMATIGLGKPPSLGGGGGGGGKGFALGAGDAAGALGGGFGAIGSLASAGLAGGVAAVAAATVALGNDYIETSNKAQHLVAEGDNVNAMLERQYTASVQLHGSLKEVIALADAADDAFEDVAMTGAEMASVTMSVGAQVRLAGKDLSEGTQVIKELGDALDRGTTSEAQLKAVARDFPDVMQRMTDSTGKTKQELYQLARQGKISGQALVDAFELESANAMAKVGQASETLGQKFDHAKDRVMLTVGAAVKATGVFDALGNVLSIVTKGVDILVGVVGKVTDVVGGALDALGPLGDALGYMAKGPVGWVQTGLGLAGDAFDWLSGKMKKNTTEAEANARAQAQQAEVAKKVAAANQEIAKVANVVGASKRLGIETGNYDENAARIHASLKIQTEEATRLAGVVVKIPPMFEETTTRAVQLEKQTQKLADQRVMDRMAEDVHRVWKELNGINDVLDEQRKRYAALADKLTDYEKAIAEVQARIDAANAARQVGPGLAPKDKDGKPITAPSQAYVNALVDAKKMAEIDKEYADQPRLAEILKSRYTKTSGLVDLKDALKATTITYKEYVDGIRALGYEETREEKWYKSITGPMKEYKADLAALKNLYDSKTISARQYADALETLVVPGLDKIYERGEKLLAQDVKISAAKKRERETGVSSPLSRGDLSGSSADEYQAEIDAQGFRNLEAAMQSAGQVSEERYQRQQQILEQIRTPAETFRQKLHDINMAWQEGERDSDGYRRVVADLRDKFLGALTPEREFARDMRQLNELSKAAKFSTEEYARALDEVNKKHNVGRGFSEGMSDGLKTIRAEVVDVAGVTKQAFTDAFHAVNESVLDLITTWDTDFQKLGQTLLRSIARVALVSLENKGARLLGLAGDGPGGAALSSAAAATAATTLAGGVSTGGATAAATIASAMTGAGASVAAMLAGAMTAGGAAGGAAEAAGSAFAEAASEAAGSLFRRAPSPGPAPAGFGGGTNAARTAGVSLKVVNVFPDDKGTTLRNVDTPDGDRVVNNAVTRHQRYQDRPLRK